LRDAIVRYALLLLLALAASGPRPQFMPVQAPNPHGYVEQVHGLPVLHLQGSPYEMGLQQGSSLRNSIRGFVTQYLYERVLLDHEVSGFGLRVFVRLLDRDVPATLRREMQGIADGAGLPYQDILLLNIVPELLALTRWMHSWELSPLLRVTTQHSFASCAEFAAWGQATLNRELVVGYSVDCLDTDLLSQHPQGAASIVKLKRPFPRDCPTKDTQQLMHEAVVVTVRRPFHGNAFASVSLAGQVGVWAGMNEEKIIATLASSPSGDVASCGQPLSLLLRQALERAGDLTEAADIVLAAKRLHGGNVILGDGKAPKAITIEASAHRYAIFEPGAEGDLIVRTNHFLDPELALIQCGAIPVSERADSEARLTGLQGLLAPSRGWIGVREGLSFLRNDYASRDEGGTLHSAESLHRVLFYPGEMTMWVSQDSISVSPRSYVDLDLRSLLFGDR